MGWEVGVRAASALPCSQTSLVPHLLGSGFVVRQGKGMKAGEAWGRRGPWVCLVLARACQPLSPLSLFPSLLSGVPLLFVIPWGIVKYLYEDEG